MVLIYLNLFLNNMVDFKEILFELIRDVKSRKFLLSVAGLVLVVSNSYFDLGLSVWDLVIAVAPAVIFIIVEGIADIVER